MIQEDCGFQIYSCCFLGCLTLRLLCELLFSYSVNVFSHLRTNKTTPYATLPTEAWFANSLGMLILVFGLLVLWALATPTWKRPDVDLHPEIQEVKNDAGL